MTEPKHYTDNLLYDRCVLPANYRNLDIQPGGWLTAIMVSVMGPHEEMEFWVVDHDFPKNDPFSPYAKFTVQIQDIQGGKWFDPIPNLNAAHPYTLLIPPNTPPLEVISINRRQA